VSHAVYKKETLMTSDNFSWTNMLFYRIVPIDVPWRDHGVLESNRSLPKFCKRFVYL